MNNNQQQPSLAVSEQSRRLKELKQELNQIKQGNVSSLNRTAIRGSQTNLGSANLDDSTNKTMLMGSNGAEKMNQTTVANNSMMMPPRANKFQKRSSSREAKQSTLNHNSSNNAQNKSILQKPVIDYYTSSSDDERDENNSQYLNKLRQTSNQKNASTYSGMKNSSVAQSQLNSIGKDQNQDNRSIQITNSSDSKHILCQKILDIFTKSSQNPAASLQDQKDKLDQPQSKSLKMSQQVKLDRIREVVNLVELDLGFLESSVRKELDRSERDEEAGKRRKETATKMITELEKKLFDSERERVILRRERDDLQRDIKDISQQSERNTLNDQMLGMIRENQKRLEESNIRMQELIVRQEKEMQDKEEAWTTELNILKEKFSHRIKSQSQQQQNHYQ
eukprot:403364798